MLILEIFFLFLHKTVCCWYSLEGPHSIPVYGELEKIILELLPNSPPELVLRFS